MSETRKRVVQASIGKYRRTTTVKNSDNAAGSSDREDTVKTAVKVDYEVGYKRPSKAHQFPKGYSPHRNYRGRPKKKKATMAEEIDRAFETEVRAQLRPGSPVEAVRAFDLIVRRLYEKALAGDGSALVVLEKYKIYAASKPIVEFVRPNHSIEESGGAYAALLANGIEIDSLDGSFEFEGIIFTPESPVNEIADAYYRSLDKWNEQNEKKIQRRKLF